MHTRTSTNTHRLAAATLAAALCGALAAAPVARAADLRAESLRMLRSGRGVVVAVIDTGVDLDHPALTGQLWTNPHPGVDGYSDDLHGWNFAANSPDIGDRAGHGTAVAGIIVAARDGRGFEGVAPDARLMVLKVGETETAISIDDVARAIVYAVRHGADVINISITAPIAPRDLLAAVAYARRSGVIIVAAAGNDGSDTSDLPGGLPGVLRVGALGPDGAVPDFSNANPAVVAPGVGVLTARASGAACEGCAAGERTTTVTGTSFAAAQVSGVAALLREGRPNLDGDALTQLLRDGARDVGAPGTDARSGAGAVDADAAAAQLGITAPPDALPPAAASASASLPREQFVAQLLAARGITADAPIAANLVFDAFHSPYAREIATAKSRGILLGRWFQPLRAISRSEALTLVGRTVPLPSNGSAQLLPRDLTDAQRELETRAFAGGFGAPWSSRELDAPLTAADAAQLLAALRLYDPARAPF